MRRSKGEGDREREGKKRQVDGIMIGGKQNPRITHDEHSWRNFRAPHDHQHTDALNTSKQSIYLIRWLPPRGRKRSESKIDRRG